MARFAKEVKSSSE